MTLQGVKQRFSIIGRSEALDNALGTAIRVASTDLTVLIQGESGVGKEVFSKIIHNLSKRKHNSFIAINCGAIPEGTINSELFGHEKGAFTGATSDRSGYFETVDGGTIFLDEIGEMPLDTQSYLLRVLESGEFMKVGSSVVRTTDVRVIAATNVDLMKLIQKGKFREDLYYRLNTVPIRVPALHERREDIYMLFRKFAIDFSEKYRSKAIQLTRDAQNLIELYRWPGNVRELKNLVEQLSVMSDKELLSAQDLLEYAPKLGERDLPALQKDRDAEPESFQERELLYKFLFDMKSDLNDLKSLVFEMIKSNDLDVSSLSALQDTENQHLSRMMSNYDTGHSATKSGQDYHAPVSSHKPIILDRESIDKYDAVDVEEEENLSLENMEKELIGKALVKHKGKRKDAAEELGISERTLYRKIKQYEIEE